MRAKASTPRGVISFLIAAAIGSFALAPHAAAAPSGSFSDLGFNYMELGRHGHLAAPLPDGRVLIAGGFGGDGSGGCGGCGTWLDEAEVFDPDVGAFSASGIGPMTSVRYGPAAAPLEDGRVLVAGGFLGGDPLVDFHNPAKFTASAEVFNPGADTFSATGIGAMTATRWGAAAARLPDGRVLVAGGWNGSSYLGSAEVFDPATNTFSSAGIGTMTMPRLLAAAAPLPDGRILVAGGYNDSGYLASVEIFDPDTNSFSSAGIGPMTVARRGGVAAPLPDGRILLVGGAGLSGVRLRSAEAFDPATGLFSAAGIGGMVLARYEAAAATLPDGRVLVVGGRSALPDAEIFSLHPPPPPELLATDPPSPANQIHTPFVSGKAEPDSTVRLHANASCAGEPLAVVPAGDDGSFRVRVSVAPVTSTTMHATATNVIGTSDCSAGLTYQDVAVFCRGQSATIFGTEGSDQLTGTEGLDVIQASGGVDTISGLGGADVLCGGSGKDNLSGGGGRDTLAGEAGSDRLVGGRGVDLLIGGGGEDRCGAARTDRRRSC